MWERRINVVRGGSILRDLKVEPIGIVVEKVDGILVSVVTNRFGSERLLLEGLLVQFILLLGILLGGDELSLGCLGRCPLLSPNPLFLLLFSIVILGRKLLVILVLLRWFVLCGLSRSGLFVCGLLFLCSIIAVFAAALLFGLLQFFSRGLLGCFLSLLILDGVPYPLQVNIRKSFLLLELIQLTTTIVDLPGKIWVVGQDVIGERTEQGKNILGGQVPRVRSSKFVERLPQGASLGTKVCRISLR
mmetsp:Transcript_1284/g.3703  ORF Transcript_1284/g.3703 Transcript_1284/m.3703 type:complete len:246 (+) Transcript_1284:2000-2737(+)